MEANDPELRGLIPAVGCGHRDRERDVRETKDKEEKTNGELIDLINAEPD